MPVSMPRAIATTPIIEKAVKRQEIIVVFKSEIDFCEPTDAMPFLMRQPAISNSKPVITIAAIKVRMTVILLMSANCPTSV
jgi:hypothetical protein